MGHLDIMSILQKDPTNLFGLYSVQVKVVDVYGQVIGCSPLWIISVYDKMPKNPPLPFPIPTPTRPPLPWNNSNPPYNPFPCPPSEVPIDMNDINNFFRDITNTTDSTGGPPFLPEKGEIELVIPYWYDVTSDNYYVWRIRFYK